VKKKSTKEGPPNAKVGLVSDSWIEVNRGALDDHNRRIDERGLFSDGKRMF